MPNLGAKKPLSRVSSLLLSPLPYHFFLLLPPPPPPPPVIPDTKAK